MDSSSSHAQQSQPMIEDPIHELAKGLALLPVRPRYKGQKGTAFALDANYFALKLPKELVVHRYSIEIVPHRKPSLPKEPPKKISTPAAPKTIFPRPINTSVSGGDITIRPKSEDLGNVAGAKDAPVPSSQSAQDNSSSLTVPTGKKAEQVIKLLLDLPDLRQYKNAIFTDFRAILYSRRALPQTLHGLQVQYRAENNAVARPNALTYTVRLIENARLDLSALVDRYQGGDLTLFQYDRQDLIQALNIFFLHYARTSPDCLSIGGRRSFPGQNSVPEGARWDVGRGVNALRGAFCSVRVVDSSILVNVNICHGAFYNGGPLVTLIDAFRGNGQHGAELEAFIRRLRVGLTHFRDSNGRAIPANQNVKTILGFARRNDGMSASDNPPEDYHRPRVTGDFAGPEAVSFWYQEESGRSRWITVSAYFKKRYNITLNRNRPVINVGSAKKPTYLGIEVCEVMHGQIYKKKLDRDQTTKMTEGAVRPNSGTKNLIITQGLQNVGLSSSNRQLALFNIKSEQKMSRVSGRRLGDPTLLYRLPQKVSPMHGAWSMRDVQYREGTSLPMWSYLELYYSHSNNYVPMAIKKFRPIAEMNGLKSPTDPASPRPYQIAGPNDPRLADLLKACKGAGVKLLLVVLPQKDTRLYQFIKRIGDVQQGLHTVCVVKQSFCKGAPAYYGNVALKINLKLGGVNHELQKHPLGILGEKEKQTMVVGIDVTHPSPGSSSDCPSIAAMVASVDNKLGQWPAVLRLQRATQQITVGGEKQQSQLAPRQEIVSEIGEMLESRLRLWYLNNKNDSGTGRLPENILVYRDGVSEGQYKAVIEQEIKAIKERCQSVYGAQRKALPRLTFIVVAKRHHTRFFPPFNVPASQKDRNGNPRNGTVVDNGITDNRIWDFFLQSHTPLQGTARPAHYVVLRNEIFAEDPNVADTVESITYNLCWVYGRATRAVSYCTPAYYADRACERARCYLSNYFDHDAGDGEAGGAGGPRPQDLLLHPDLEDTMFYI